MQIPSIHIELAQISWETGWILIVQDEDTTRSYNIGDEDNWNVGELTAFLRNVTLAWENKFAKNGENLYVLRWNGRKEEGEIYDIYMEQLEGKTRF